MANAVGVALLLGLAGALLNRLIRRDPSPKRSAKVIHKGSSLTSKGSDADTLRQAQEGPGG
jgi:hypothetical protein